MGSRTGSRASASSGNTVRHRLNRGGDRAANAALYRIVICRLRWDPRTRAYVDRRTQEGRSKKEIIRCLKRYIAREVHQLLLHPHLATTGRDLRTARRQLGHTQAHVAHELSVDPIRISEIENDRRCAHETTARYRSWLDTQLATCTA